MTKTDLSEVIGRENLLILAAEPGDETLLYGGIIAESCRRGRPPYVMVLSDGSLTPPSNDPAGTAARHERETRGAVRSFGLPEGRLLMVGLYEGTIPGHGPVFDAVVRAVTLVMWARDCNVLVTPAEGATRQIAAAVAATSGVGLAEISNPTSAR